MPRAVAVLSDGVLIAERKPLWFVEDTDGDGRGDRKTLVDSIYGGNGMPEHSPNGLWRGWTIGIIMLRRLLAIEE